MVCLIGHQLVIELGERFISFVMSEFWTCLINFTLFAAILNNDFILENTLEIIDVLQNAVLIGVNICKPTSIQS